MEPHRHEIDPYRVKEAIIRAIRKTKADNPGVAITALIMVIIDTVTAFEPKDREWVVENVARVLTDATRAAVKYFPEEFGKQTTNH